jgi:hypothetical protein
MSLWLQSLIESIGNYNYPNVHKLLEVSPRELPKCMLREIEYGETHCSDKNQLGLFPIRALWLLECNEQSLFGLSPLGRSYYHPEKIWEVWNRVLIEESFCNYLKDQGMRFDFEGKAMELSYGWVYIGESFIDDLIEIENNIGTEMMFPDLETREPRAVFRSEKAKLTKRKK